MIWKARRLRKALGGGMRQTGDQHFYQNDHHDYGHGDYDDVGDFYDDHCDFDDFDCFSHNGCDNCADGNRFHVL